MRIARISIDDAQRLAVIGEAEVRCTDHGLDLRSHLRAGGDARALERACNRIWEEPPRWRAPIRPGKIVAIGLNYRDHAREAGLDIPDHPLVFAKFPSAVIGPDEPVLIDPSLTKRVDWEVELAVVIGTRMRNIDAVNALGHVFGYTVANDVSARDVQFDDGQWVRGKSFDSFCPL